MAIAFSAEDDIIVLGKKWKKSSKDAKIIRIRTEGIIHTYNAIIDILGPTFTSTNDELKRKVKNKILKYREKLTDSLKILNAQTIMPNDITEKEIEEMIYTNLIKLAEL